MAMSALVAIVCSLLLYLLIRLLHLTQPSAAPIVYVKDRSSDFVQSVLEMCPSLNQPYVPTFLWGKSGHVQTLLYAKMGRVNVPVAQGIRHSKVMEDGSTLFFDLYEPEVRHATQGNYCILFCPGIGNSAESSYIQTLVHHALNSGYLSVVLNHLGALKYQKLSAPRLFTYGGTHDLHCVRAEIQRLYPTHKLLLVGLSMGANIVVKYLGESEEHQRGVLGAVSFCQGYDIHTAVELGSKDLLGSWKGMRRGYQMVITANQKQIIKRHEDVLLSCDEMERMGLDCDQRQWHREVMGARTLNELDEAYTRKKYGFENLDEFYKYHSSCNYIFNVKTPLLIVNAMDDPIVPDELLKVPKDAARNLPYCIFALTKHGGHLGYFEDGWVKPQSITWMDRLIVEYADAITKLHHGGVLPTLSLSSPAAHSQPPSDSSSAEDICQISLLPPAMTSHLDVGSATCVNMRHPSVGSDEVEDSGISMMEHHHHHGGNSSSGSGNPGGQNGSSIGSGVPSGGGARGSLSDSLSGSQHDEYSNLHHQHPDHHHHGDSQRFEEEGLLLNEDGFVEVSSWEHLKTS